MAMTAADILETYPEFATAPDAQDLYVSLANQQTAAATVWGSDDLRELAVALLAAHMMARAGLGTNAAGAGPVSSESIGAASITYAAPGGFTEGDFSTTSYGQQLLELRRATIFAATTTYAG